MHAMIDDLKVSSVAAVAAMVSAMYGCDHILYLFTFFDPVVCRYSEIE